MSVSDVYPRKVRTRPWHNLRSSHIWYMHLLYTHISTTLSCCMILPYIRPPYASTMHEYDHALSDFREKAWRASKSKQLSCTHWFFFGPMPIAVVACFLAVVEIVSCPYRSIKLIGCASRQPATWLRLGYRMCECEVAYNRESDGWNMVNLCEAL